MHHKNFIDEIKVAIQVALFKQKDIHHVASDKKKMAYGFYILGVGALLSFLGMHFFSPFAPVLLSGILMAVMHIVMAVISFYVISYIAKKLFNGHGKHDAFFRVMAYGSIVGWVAFIPMFGFVAAIWGLALLFVVLTSVHKLKTGQAVLTIIIGMIVMAVVSMILSPLTGMGNKMHDGDFRMNFKGDDGEGAFMMKDGKFRMETEDGEVFEMEIPE